jgi:hypothetical protein
MYGDGSEEGVIRNLFRKSRGDLVPLVMVCSIGLGLILWAAQEGPVVGIAELLERLGSDDVEVRDQAAFDLGGRLDEARPVLERSVEDPDLEVALRAREILVPADEKVVCRTVGHLLSHGCDAFRRGKWAQGIAYCDSILRIDPHYSPAIDLRRACHRPRDGLPEALTLWLAQDNPLWDRLPLGSKPRLLSRVTWLRLQSAIAIRTHVLAPNDDQDPDILAINRKLDTLRIDVVFEKTKLQEILDFIAESSGLRLVFDADLASLVDSDKEVTFKAKDLVLKRVLQLLLSFQGLVYAVTAEKEVLITTPYGRTHGR